MSKTVFDIKAGIQDYINTTNDDPHTIKQTIIKTLDFFNSVNYIHRYNCRSIAVPPGMEITIEPGDNLGKVYNLRFFYINQTVTTAMTVQEQQVADPVKSYDRAMKGIY